MSAPIYVDSDYTVASATGKPRLTYPFQNDFVSFYYEQEFDQFFDNFQRVPLDTQATISVNGHQVTVYMVEESPLQDVGGGVCKWTRTYSVIPESRTEFSSYSWLRPGLSSGNIYPIYPVVSGSNSGNTTVLTTTGNSGLSTGDFCLVHYTVTLSNGQQLTRQVFRPVISGGGTSVTVAIILDVSTPFYISVQKVDQSRDPFTLTVPCVLQYDYALPGVSAGITKPSDFQIFRPPLVLDNTGKETQIYGTDTTPTRAQYLAQVANADLIVAEASIIRVWKGNILERLTRYVTAI